MKEKSLSVQLVVIGFSIMPAVYIGLVHTNLLESILAYIIILGSSSIILKKWYLMLNGFVFLVVLTFVLLIGGTL